MSVRDLLRTDLQGLRPYDSSETVAELERRLGRPIVKLDANENPYGPSPLVAEALLGCSLERYPDASYKELRENLGGYLGVDAARVVCGAGGDELLDLLLRLFLEPGDEVITCTPSFAVYELDTTYSRGKVVRVPRDERFAVDVAAVERALSPRTKVIFICSPNNPTGNRTAREDLVTVLEWGRIVVLDEAYAEFAGRDELDLVDRYPNLVVLRTMSKWAALAGVRLGYAVMAQELAAELNKIRQPYNVGVPAEAAALASLQDREYLFANVEHILAERVRLGERLAALPFGRLYPSETNFLYWTTDGVSAHDLQAALAERGVLVRAYIDPVEALRIAVGKPEESDVLMAELEDVYGELSRG